MNISDQKRIRVILIISIVFVIWSAFFIYQSSFVAFDGQRYFCLFDDAMISMRYAWNFSHGIGLVWNEGETVQGYTNLLMTLIMSLATLIFNKSNAVLCIQTLGVCFMLSIAYVNMRIADYVLAANSDNDDYCAFLGIVIFISTLSYYPLVYFSLMGMETGLLTLLLLLGLSCAFHYVTTPSFKTISFASSLFGLAYMTRPDSIIFSFLVLLYLAWNVLDSMENRQSFNHLLVAVGIFCAFVLGQLCFQYFYYGEILPNTYALKLKGMPIIARLKNGIAFIKHFLIWSFPILFLAVVSLYFRFGKKNILLFCMIVSAIGYQIYVGGDAWLYWRMLSPIIPLAFILAIGAIGFVIVKKTVNFALRVRLNVLRHPKPLAFVLAIVLLFFENAPFSKEITFMSKPFLAIENHENVSLALALNDVLKDNASIGVFWAGSIPYYAGRKAIDFLGKSDRHIANLAPDLSGSVGGGGMNSVPGHNKYDLNYSIRKLQPTFIDDFKWGTQNLAQWVGSKYVLAEYRGMRMILLKDSPHVYWEKVNFPGNQ